MYFWQIDRLKTDLAARPMTGREALPYMIVSLCLSVIVYTVPGSTGGFNEWDVAAFFLELGAIIGGTLFIYDSNGGAAGRQFLARYFAVSWVVSVRCVLALLGVAFGFCLVASMLDLTSNTTNTGPVGVILGCAAQFFIIWRVGHHIQEIAQRTTWEGPAI